MKRSAPSVDVAALAAFCLLSPIAAQAAVQDWKFDEVFSSADGSVQFIEMSNMFDGENAVGGQTLVSGETAITVPFSRGGANGEW